ncbi:MAG: TBC domain-containing protein [Candidatus Thermoplasmatota archaeon]|nr:TBC domain-containing protein [Candidatus Thermoplasmatota archaeon]
MYRRKKVLISIDQEVLIKGKMAAGLIPFSRFVEHLISREVLEPRKGLNVERKTRNNASHRRKMFIVSAKMPMRISQLIEAVLQDLPRQFPNKSSFVRRAIIRQLRDLGYVPGATSGRTPVDGLRECGNESASRNGNKGPFGDRPPEPSQSAQSHDESEIAIFDSQTEEKR